MKPTKIDVLGKIVKDFFQGETYVSITFTDDSQLHINVDGYDDGLEVRYEE